MRSPTQPARSGDPHRTRFRHHRFRFRLHPYPATRSAYAVDTFTVQTRRGFHYYFATADQPVTSRKFPGLDLKADGGYVVAPPASGYTIVDDRPPRPITAAALAALITHLLDQHPDTPSNRCFPPVPVHSMSPTPDAALHHYHRRVTDLGSRNTALFLTACQLRDSGASLAWTLDALTDAHIHTPAPAAHPHETDAQRRREAHATIRSAYGRPPRSRPQPARTDRVAFSDNAAREVMLQADKTSATAFWRCYDGLILSGITPGETFTYAHARALLAPLGVGRRALDQFVRADHLIDRVLVGAHGGAPSTPNPISPAPGTPPPVETAWQASNLIEQNAFVPTTKRSQLKRGKKPTVYTLPDLDTLCQRLGVLRTPGDPITAADVRTPTTYRASLEREFIRRRPGRYSLGLLAARLGVTPRSIQRYHAQEVTNAADTVHSAPTFDTYEQITPHNLDAIPFYRANEPSKFFLEDSLGRFYPPRPQTALWLLNKGRRVYLKVRGFNYYWVGDPPAEIAPAITPPLPEFGMDWSERIRQRGEAISQLLYEREIALNPDPVVPLPPVTRPTRTDLTHLSSADEHSPRDGRAGDEHPTRENSAGARHPSHGKKKRGKRYFHAPLPDARSEYLAQRVTNWTKSQDAKHALSLPNARRFVEIFGYPAVDTALENASQRSSRRRQKLTNPAGFIVTATRGNYVEFYQRPAPRYEVEQPPHPPLSASAARRSH